MNKEIRLGNVYNENARTGFAGNVWDINGISPTLTCAGNGGQTTDDRRYLCCASRGRNQDGRWIQQLEINLDGITNAITQVEKDNYILEICNVESNK